MSPEREQEDQDTDQTRENEFTRRTGLDPKEMPEDPEVPEYQPEGVVGGTHEERAEAHEVNKWKDYVAKDQNPEVREDLNLDKKPE